MPTPSGYDYIEADFDSADSTRSETGVLNRDRIRRAVLSPQFTWQAITTAQLNIILKAVEPERIMVTCFAPKLVNGILDEEHTFEGYAQATRTATVVCPKDDPMETIWKISLSFIEY